jgi:hypothetical protein
MGFRAGLDTETRRKVLSPCRCRTPVVQSVVRHYTDWATLAPRLLNVLFLPMAWDNVSELPPPTVNVSPAGWELRLNDTDRGQLKNAEKSLSRCHFVHHKFHMDWPGRDRGPPWWKASDWPLETWHGLGYWKKLTEIKSFAVTFNFPT